MNSWPSVIFSAMGLLAASELAYAGLAGVDSGPYTVATGRFPMWYVDQNDLKLELCQSRATSSRVAATVPPSYMCVLNAEPGVYDDALPMVFPDNFPGELFWHSVETSIPAVGNSGYELEVYVAAVEAAFNNDAPIDGDQTSFARIRIRAAIPTPGVYTITHPFGVETINVTGTGRRAINLTRDIGIGAPGDFSGALNGNIGPFVRSVNGPYTEINPDTGTSETFIGDPSLNEPITGSPNNTNFLRIQGPAGTIQTNLFTVSGKVFDPRAQTPMELRRATYRRNNAGAQVELFAHAPNSANLCYRDTLALVPGSPPSACQFNLTSDNNGNFFIRQPATAGVPPFVVVTASSSTGATKPTPVSSKLIDVVKINTARYSWDNQTLVVEATSSDETAVPDLVAQGFGRLSKSGIAQQLSVTGLAQPPASVTIKSAAGGADTEPVTIVGTAPGTGENQPPVAVADTGSTGFGVPLTLNVLANDSDPDNDVPLTVSDLTQPASGLGTVAVNGSTSVVYTPPAVVNAPIQALFTYRVTDAKGLKSAPASVTVTVSPNLPPVAGNDTGATLAGAPLTINVLANDSDPEGNLPLTLTNLTQPAVGRGTVSISGTTLLYTPPATITGPFTATFTYQVSDSFGGLSTPATVNVQVTAPPANQETLTITSATVQARAGNRFSWDLAGTTSVIAGNTITVQVTTPNGLVTLDSVAVPVTGRWRISVVNAIAPSATNPTATARSSVGTVRTLPVTVR